MSDEFHALLQTISLPIDHMQAVLVHSAQRMDWPGFLNAYAKRLLCQNQGQASGKQPCGHCDGCRAHAAGTHPDFRLLSVDLLDEKNSTSSTKSIKIDALRALTDLVQKRSTLGGRKVLSLSHAESLTQQAANACLKWIEEPSDSVFWIFSSQDLSRVLPTIRSRLQLIDLASYQKAGAKNPKGEMATWPDFLSHAHRSALGVSPTQERLEEYEKTYKLWFSVLKTLEVSPLLASDAFLESEKHVLLDVLQCWWTAFLSEKQQLPLDFASYGAFFQSRGQAYPRDWNLEGAFRILDCIEEIRRRLNSQIVASGSYLVDGLFIQMSKALTQSRC